MTKSFDEVRFDEIAAGVRPALAGVQDKASASMISVPVSRAHERYILKLNPPENPYLVENEAWFLGVATQCGISVAPSRIVRDADGQPGLLVTRFDRVAAASLAVELGVREAVIDKLLGDVLARAASLGDQLLASGLPFDRRVLDKTARQLTARHRALGG